MNQLDISCSCGEKCGTNLIVEKDKEKPHNLLFTLKNKVHFWGLFISLGREDSLALARFILRFYKEVG